MKRSWREHRTEARQILRDLDAALDHPLADPGKQSDRLEELSQQLIRFFDYWTIQEELETRDADNLASTDFHDGDDEA